MPNNEPPRHAKLARSNVVLNNGLPKLPSPERLVYGEIAVNYATDNETISIKNSNNSITTFKPNTNVFVKNFTTQITTQDVCNVLSLGMANKYQDFNISFLEAYDDDLDLFDIVNHVRTNFYDTCNLHIMLNVAKASDECKRTCFYINSETLQEIIDDGNSGENETKLSNKSTIIGFSKFDEYFVAGDSDAMNGIEINWDKTSKIMTMKFVYMENAYRMDGNTIG